MLENRELTAEQTKIFAHWINQYIELYAVEPAEQNVAEAISCINSTGIRPSWINAVYVH